MKNTELIDNFAHSVTHGFDLRNSTLLCEEISVDNAATSGSLESFVDFGFFSLNSRSNVTIRDSTFTRVEGLIASLIYVTGLSSITLSDTTIKDVGSSRCGPVVPVSGGPLIFMRSIDEATFSGVEFTDVFVENIRAEFVS